MVRLEVSLSVEPTLLNKHEGDCIIGYDFIGTVVGGMNASVLCQDPAIVYSRKRK